MKNVKDEPKGGRAEVKPPTAGGDVFIVDNSDEDWKVVRYLQEWAEISRAFDIATGYFEIGALLALNGRWQKLDKIRILMGAETTYRTRNLLVQALRDQVKQQLDQSIEKEKESNDFLSGVPAILAALRSGQIECRVYSKRKFHAKAYITHARFAVVGSAALVGSSNFTQPGLTQNIELNIQVKTELDVLQEWFERHWQESEEITPELIQIIDRHIREYTPFEVYAKALQEFFRGHEMTVGEWERNHSAIYPMLDQYQKEGYQALMKIGALHKGALLCDGVGLGKTFIGLMLIDRLVNHERKKVVLIVPKSGREPVWETELGKRLPDVWGDFSNLVIFNHTDLTRGNDFPKRFERVARSADVIIIDEAHHFRNPGIKGEGTKAPSRYWKMFDLCQGKAVFFLTATPVNNSLLDLQHMVELFSRRQTDYFKAAPLGIHSLPGHFRKMENALKQLVGGNEGDLITNQAEAEKILQNDSLFQALVVQRSRAYVKRSQIQNNGNQATFPRREAPKVAAYSVKRTYGKLLKMIDEAFSKEKPLFSLAIYNPLAYYVGGEAIEAFEEGRQKQVVGLIRIQFLKRFESSAFAFEQSCVKLLLKMLAFVSRHSTTRTELNRLERWKNQNMEILDYVQIGQAELTGEEPLEDDDLITEEMLEEVEVLNRETYQVDEILQETFLDLDQIVKFLAELKKFKPQHDDKLKALVSLLKQDPVLSHHKVLIFSEFMTTARYLERQLKTAGIDGVSEVDSATKVDRGKVIRAFAPYYNGTSSSEIAAVGEEIRVLISTDVLSEGLNLQDATRLINYDLHWNPVRLMQRIGRVDRRLNPQVENRILTDHPEQSDIRGTVAYWNFLPPDELDDLLKLYRKVSQKTLRISKTFGIEGKKLLKPEDDYEALREFNEAYEGTTTTTEEMHLEFQRMIKDIPDLESRLSALPGRVFSGKAHPAEGTRAVFFCYALPAPESTLQSGGDGEAQWSEEAGYTKWYLCDVDSGAISDDPSGIVEIIRSKPETPRKTQLPPPTLGDIRKNVEKHIRNTYLKQVVAPAGVKATLKAWMELS